jgi:hypothetical protein
MASALYSWRFSNVLNDAAGLKRVKVKIGLSNDDITHDELVPAIREIYRTTIDKVDIEYE